MQIKTAELSSEALDWVVATCEGYKDLRWNHNDCVDRHMLMTPLIAAYGPVFLWELGYSTDWALAGPIIERENITLERNVKQKGCAVVGFYDWYASHPKNYGGLIRHSASGATALIAAMRCYVAAKLGDSVEVPDELVLN